MGYIFTRAALPGFVEKKNIRNQSGNSKQESALPLFFLPLNLPLLLGYFRLPVGYYLLPPVPLAPQKPTRFKLPYFHLDRATDSKPHFFLPCVSLGVLLAWVLWQ